MDSILQDMLTGKQNNPLRQRSYGCNFIPRPLIIEAVGTQCICCRSQNGGDSHFNHAEQRRMKIGQMINRSPYNDKTCSTG